jgi:cytochrome P450
VALVGPPPLKDTNPLSALWSDVRDERSASVPFPPGDTSFSMVRSQRFDHDPLPLLLESYERYGPVFSLRLLHTNAVFMLGPAANHYMTVSHASNFLWRFGYFRELTGLMGDGLLTIDGDFHRQSRQIMLPAFHREQIAKSVDLVIEETEAALDSWRPGDRIDLYSWTRHLSLRVAMRALFGLDPDSERVGSIDAAELFERALSFYARPYIAKILRGPGSPWRRMQQTARDLNRLIYAEIADRRAGRRPSGGESGGDILSLLLQARDENGNQLSDRQIRDEVMTLMFAGHDTTTSTIAFMFYELAGHPQIVDRLQREQDEQLAGGRPTIAQLTSGDLEQLEMVLEETLRKYPPAWIGPRRSVEPFEFEGVPVPGRAFVSYCSWASHHLPDVFNEPDRFIPERFTPDARAALPKGAYVPFGGGSRTCIGMRFGQLEVRTIAALIVSRFTLSLPDGFALAIRQMPTISPRQGLPMIVGERSSRGKLRAQADRDPRGVAAGRT